VSGLRENLTSRSDGEGLETGPGDRLRHRHEAKAAGNSNSLFLPSPRQSFTRQLINRNLKTDLGLGQHQVRGDLDRHEKSFGIALLAYLLVLRLRHHEIVPGKPWSLSELQHSLRLGVITNQVEHNVTVKLASQYKAA
jgi:hypothetical protein